MNRENPVLWIRDELVANGHPIDEESFAKAAAYCEKLVTFTGTRVRPFDPQVEQLAHDLAPPIVKAFLAAARLRHVPVELVEVSTDKYGQYYCRWRVMTKDITLDTSGFVEITFPPGLNPQDGTPVQRRRQLRLDKQSWPWFSKLVLGD